MESPLEAVQFLANSANRVEVLGALVDGQATRRELQEEVAVSRSTVARILEGARERGWVESEGSHYWVTPLGEAMLADFRSYLNTVEGYQHLGEMVNHLPPPLFSLDFRHLRAADIIEVAEENPAAPFTRSLDLFKEADRYRGLCHTSLPQHAKVLRDGVEQERLDFEHVFEKAFIETLRADPERAAVWNSLSDRSWLYDGVVPINLHIVDDTVLVWLGRTRGEPAGLLESEDATVRSWAESLYEEFRTDSEPLPEV